MNRQTHIMLDLETMGKTPTAAIIAIGAVEFDPVEGAIGGSFYQLVDLENAVAWGGTMDASTVRWWLGRSDAQRAALLEQDAACLHNSLLMLSRWIGERGEKADRILWANGAGFDFPIIRHAYACCGEAAPWEWWNERCYRTMKALRRDVATGVSETSHHACLDAINQAEHLNRIMRAMNLGRA